MLPNSSLKIDLAEFKRGWRVLLVCVIGVVTSACVLPLYSFGPLVQPLQTQFGWTRGEVQSTMTFFFIGMIFSAQIAGSLMRRFGVRNTVVWCLVAFALGFVAATQINKSIWSLYLLYAALPLIGAGTQMVVWTQVTSLWFEKNRGLALAITLSGTGLSAFVLTPIVAVAIEHFGWQTAFIVLALAPLATALPLAWLWLPNGGPVAAQSSYASVADVSTTRKDDTLAAASLTGLDYGEAVRSYRFWIVTVALMLVVIGVLGMLTNTVPLMRDNGVEATTAANIFGAYGISLIIGRTVAGYLIDRLWAPGVAFVTLTMPAVGCLIFGIENSNTILLTLAAMLVGIGAGAEYDFASYLVVRYFGLRDYGRIFGTFFAITSAGVCFAPGLFGMLYDRTGGYNAMLWICGTAFVIGPAALLSLGAYPDFERRAARPT
jgi:MFS family permease